MKAWECVWIAGEKGAGWCVCVAGCVCMFGSPKTLHQNGLHGTNSCHGDKDGDHDTLNLTVITAH